MTRARLRAGLVGLGVMGARHARVLSVLTDVDWIAAADPAGDPHGIAGNRAVNHHIQGLLNEGLDYVVIACPTSGHLHAGLTAASAGVPSLIEKPLAVDTAEADQLVRAYQDSGIPAAVGYSERFHPAVIALRRYLSDGLIGDVHAIRTYRTGPHPSRITDTGVIADLATHDIDLTAWLLGTHYTSVTASAQHPHGGHHEHLAAIIAQLANAATAEHHVAWTTPDRTRTITLNGQHGQLHADLLRATLHVTLFADPSRTPRPLPLAPTDPLTAQHQAFHALLRGEPTTCATLLNARHTVATTTAASHAAQNREWKPVVSMSALC